MSELLSDTGGKEGGSKKWALVSRQGELEGSDDGASSGSSSDFVNLDEEDLVRYHHRVAPPGGSRVESGDAEDGNGVGNAATGADDLVTDTVVTPGGSDNLQAGSTDSDEPQLLERPSSSDEELAHVTAPEMSCDQADAEIETAVEDVRPSCSGDGDEQADERPSSRLCPPPGGPHSRLSFDSDSDHSDFVRLDHDAADELNPLVPEAAINVVNPLSLPRQQGVMQSSASSLASSISANFRFVRRVARHASRRHAGRYSDGADGDADDDDSVPLDVDDRCESDISGVADDDDDLSMSYNIADLPLTVGNVVRSYRHRPNTRMNTFLTVIALVTTFAAIGIGVGHYFGSVRDSRLREDRVVHMKSIQDDYMRCLKQQSSLTSQLAASTPSEKKISKVTSLWKSKYEELIFEKADLEMKMSTMNDEMKTVEDQIKSCHTETMKLKDDFAKFHAAFFADGSWGLPRQLTNDMNEEHVVQPEEKMSLEEILEAYQADYRSMRGVVSEVQRELQTCKHVDWARLHARYEEKFGECEDHKRRIRDLETSLSDLSLATSTSKQELSSLNSQLSAEREAHAHSLTDIAALKNQLNQLRTDHVDLKEKAAKLRYVEHPANSNDPPPEVAAAALKNTVNQLAHENNDLKTAIGKMRYRLYVQVVSPDGAGNVADDDGVTSEKTTSVSDSGADMGPSQVVDPNLEDEDGAVDMAYDDDVSAAAEKSTPVSDSGAGTGPSQDVHVEDPAEEGPATAKPDVETRGVQHGSEQSRGIARLVEWCQHGHGCTELWQWFYAPGKPHKEQFNPTFFACASYLLRPVDVSQWIKNTAGDIIHNADAKVRKKWAFLKETVTDSVFNDLLRRKWTEFDMVTASAETVGQARRVMETIEGLLWQKWVEFNGDARSKSTGKPKEKEGVNSSEKFQTYLNRTKETVQKLTQKIKTTWTRVKNLSSDFLAKHKPLKKIQDVGKKMQGSLKSLTKTIKSHLLEIKQKIRRGKKNLFKHGPWERAAHGKEKNHKCKKNKNGCKEHHKFASTKRRDFAATKRDKDSGRSSNGRHFKNRPHHKQSSEYEGGFEDFWRQVPFTPDEIVPEDFFEGNRREQRKQKQRFRKMNGRVERFNEELLYSMDDDDIEEMWDDFRKLRSDFDDVEEQPDRLRMWLVCQTRWWKSRFHRKHRDERKIVNGCQRQLLPWQLSVLCSHRLWCGGQKKCEKKFKPGQFCKAHAVMLRDTRGAEAVVGDEEHSGNRVVQKVPVSSSSKDVVVNGDEHELLPSAIAAENDTSSMWYLKQLKRQVDARSRDDNVGWYWSRAEDLESRQHDSSWYIRSMTGRRNLPPGGVDRQCSGGSNWMFKRANVRDFQREMPWYMKRAQNREERHFDVIPDKMEDWGGK